MGDARRRQMSNQAFKSFHPECAYCGAPTSTVDHFPPRAFFRDRRWPDDFRFPSCAACNSGTSHDELVVSALARMRLDGAEDDDYTLKLLAGIKNNRPDVMEEWFETVTRNEVRRRFRHSFGNVAGDAFRRHGYSMIHYGEKTHTCIRNFGDKLLRALHFKHVGRRADGLVKCIPLSMIEHRDAIRVAAEHAPYLQHTHHKNISLSDQFVYRFNASAELGVLFVVAQIGAQLGYMGHSLSQEFCDQILSEKPDGMRQVEEFYNRARALT